MRLNFIYNYLVYFACLVYLHDFTELESAASKNLIKGYFSYFKAFTVIFQLFCL